MSNRSISIGRDADGNVIVTGDDNRVYVFPGITELSAEVLAALQSGALAPEAAPGAVPQPDLTLRIESTGDQWTIDYPDAEDAAARTLPAPTQETGFNAALEAFGVLSRRALENDDERRMLHAHARLLGEALSAVLAPADHDLLRSRARGDGPPPLLVIESSDDAILTLPWELLHLDERYALRDGRLDLARSIPAAGAPLLEPPDEPVTLLVTVAAPTGSGLNYEAESYYITRALHDHVGVVVNEMGELDDLLAGLSGEKHRPLGVHFSGHGGPGKLLFEDQFGGDRLLDVDELLRAIRQAAPERFPRFFYLACCHGGDRDENASPTAAALHRAGVAQVVAYFGPVFDTQSTWAEAAFYRELGHGRRTRDAVRAARLAMAEPFFSSPRESSRDAGKGQDGGDTPLAWAQLVLYHRGPDYPLGMPVTRRFARTLEAPPERELAPGLGQSRILVKGFIGRREELHALRLDLRRNRRLHVVQGLGGLGKSAFCFEALKVYRRLGYQPLTLWCAEVEQERDPVAGLLRQFSDALEQTFGDAWSALVAGVDREAIKHPELQHPAKRLAFLIEWLLAREGQLPLVLYLDNLESLLTGPDNEESDAIGAWRDEPTARLWAALKRLVGQLGGRLALLASCRYRHPDFNDALMPFHRLPDDAVWRLIGWFPAIRELSVWSRSRLVGQLAGHPRAVEFLNGLIADALTQWREMHGDPPEPSTQAEAEQEWEQRVEPALPPLTERLSEDLLFEALWTRVLDESARALLVRATVLRRPADWPLLRALAAAGTEAQADTAIRRLRDSSLLTELRERRADGKRQPPRFEVHATVADLANRHSAAVDDLREQGHRLAGEFLEQRARASKNWDNDIEAAFHLGEIGEMDRAFELLLGPVQWLDERGRIQDSLAVLGQLQQPDLLDPQSRGRFFTQQGRCQYRLGNLSQAKHTLQRAIVLLQKLVEQDPASATWQQDLSVSHETIGDIFAAQNNLTDARGAYRDSLGIRQTLARQDPSNAAWQRDLSVSHGRIGNILAAQDNFTGALVAYRKGHAIARTLAQQNPSNDRWQRDLSVSYNEIGDVLTKQGKLADALDAFRDSLAIRQTLARQDPANAAWQRDLSVSHDRIGDILAAQGNLTEALGAFRDSLAIRQTLARQDPANAGWQTDLAVSYSKIASALPDEPAARAEARAYLEQGLAILKRLRDESRLTHQQLGWIDALEAELLKTG